MKITVLKLCNTLHYCLTLSWRSSRLYTILRLAGKVLAPVCGILSSFLLKYILDLLSGAWAVPDRRPALLLLIAGTAGLALLSAAIGKVVSYAEGMHNSILERYISFDLMEKALSADLEMFDNPIYYDKLTSVKMDSYATTGILWSALDCMSACVTFVSSFAILCASNWLYGALMVLAAFPSAVAGQRYTKIIYQLGLSQVNEERQKNYLYNVVSSRSYAQDVRLFGIGNRIKERYSRLWADVFKAKKKKTKGRTIWTTLLEFLPELVIAFVTLSISFNVLDGAATVGDYSLYTGLLGQLMSSVFLLIHSGMQVYENKLKIDNVKSFNDIPRRVRDEGGHTLRRVEKIEFSHITFAYPGTERKVLEDVSFGIGPGERVALVGVNGSGKTTLIKLLLRYYDPDGGEVRINGRNSKDYTLSSLRRCFSCYFQESMNFGFTLRENVTLADVEREVGDAAILQALRDSDGESVLKKAPKGLDTYLTRMFDESGMELSGGQNQKVALARTFYRDCSALILDEPSSSLDPEAEHRLFEALGRLCEGKTALFTSHRLSNITMANQIVVIENGKVVEQGTREELLNNAGRFAALYQYQAEKFTQREAVEV